MELDFGPTETIDFLRCPTYWRFNKEWEPRAVEWSPAILLGKVMGEAINQFLLDKPSPEVTAFDTIKQGFVEQDKFTLEGLNTLFERAFKKMAKTTGQEILDSETVVGCEVSIGRGRIDLVTRGKVDQRLIITDHKTSLQLKPEWILARLVEVETDWQLRDYAWRASQFYGEPVEWIRRHLIVLSPMSKSFLQSSPVGRVALEHWKLSAIFYWTEMNFLKDTPLSQLPQNLRECRGRYGKCPAFEACHTLYRDEKAMEAIYQRRGK